MVKKRLVQIYFGEDGVLRDREVNGMSMRVKPLDSPQIIRVESGNVRDNF